MKFFSLFVLSLFAPSLSGQNQAKSQILWQRNLDDALAIAKAEQRPLLVAINADGESASDQIVVERYHDPKFVEWTRHFVCVIGHPFRHNARDYDDRGLRISCPRLGEITCGEHMALESVVFEKYLGGERVSPRHALIQLDGKKSFDLSYLFDLRVLDRALEENVATAPKPSNVAKVSDKDWNSFASARDQQTRDKFEHAIASLPDDKEFPAILQAISLHGNAASLDALRVMLAHSSNSETFLDEIVKLARTWGQSKSLAEFARQRLSSGGEFPGAPGLGEDRRFLRVLVACDRQGPMVRTQLLTRFALADEKDCAAARAALTRELSPEELEKVEAVMKGEPSPVDLSVLLEPKKALDPAAAKSNPSDALASFEQLEKELEQADARMEKNPQDPEAMQALGKASLNLARSRLETGGKNVQLLLEDASMWLSKAAQKKPDDLKLGLDRARVAYFLSHFEEEEKIGLETAKRATPNSDIAIEALRWEGDGSARLLANRTKADAATEMTGLLRGLRSLTAVCASQEAGEIDWVSLASYFKALGFPREELFVLQAATRDLPESNTLRGALNASLWSLGRIDLAPYKSEWVQNLHPKSSSCAWYSGYAWMLAAENERRLFRAEPAFAAYARSRQQFKESISLNPQSEANVKHYLAMCEFGEGFTYLLAVKQDKALDSLITGLQLSPNSASSRDGLDREAVDLLDGVLEWREGRVSPIKPSEVLERFTKENLGATWFQSLSDTDLREALRADGRSDQTVTVEGKTIRLPSAEGDSYMEASILAARKALALQDSDAMKHSLAQSLTVHAERFLIRGRAEEAKPLLIEAAKLQGQKPPQDNADIKELIQVAKGLRAELGPARPIFRPGR